MGRDKMQPGGMTTPRRRPIRLVAAMDDGDGVADDDDIGGSGDGDKNDLQEEVTQGEGGDLKSVDLKSLDDNVPVENVVAGIDDPFPHCLVTMKPELKEIISKTFGKYKRDIRKAVEGGSVDALEGLSGSFNDMMYQPFIENAEFKLQPHKVRPIPAEEKVPEATEAKPLPAIFTMAESLTESDQFKTVMMTTICVAGVLVGASSYMDCGIDPSTGQGFMSCRANPAEYQICGPSCSPNATNSSCVALNQSSCEAIGCCYIDGIAQVATASPWWQYPTMGAKCYRKVPMPECFSGDSAESAKNILHFIEKSVNIIFTLEILIKLFTYGYAPWRYFMEPFNVLDFVVVAAGYIPGGENFAVLRLARLTRILKLLREVKDLQIILAGLAAGMSSISYILVMMVLVFYIFSIVCMMFFRLNDPLHFGSLELSMITLFRMSTMEDWTDVMYINMYGCEFYGYAGGAYCYEHYSKLNCDMYCSDSQAKGYAVAAFFSFFVVLVGLVIMSLFIGVITTSMAMETDKVKGIVTKAKRLEARQIVDARLQKQEDLGNAPDRASTRHLKNVKEEIIEENSLIRNYIKLADKMSSIVDLTWFQLLIMAAIVVGGLCVGIQTYPLSDGTMVAMNIIDGVILFLFIIEMFLKIIAHKFKPWLYFNNGWNVFDFIVVVACLMPPSWLKALSGGSDSTASVMRLMRLLRVLKLFAKVEELTIILNGLMKGMVSVSYIGLLLFLIYYVTGIIGIMLFRSNDPVHFGSLHGVMVTFFRCSTMEDWTDVMYVAMFGCDEYSYGDKRWWYYCEHPKSWGMVSAVFFILFEVLSSLVMLNLVVGAVCSAMQDAKDENQATRQMETELARVERLFGIERVILDEWCKEFTAVDDSDDFSAPGAIDKQDLLLVLKSSGEGSLLTHKSREHLYVAASHSSPVGQITMLEFVQALSHDLQAKRLNGEDLHTCADDNPQLESYQEAAGPASPGSQKADQRANMALGMLSSSQDEGGVANPLASKGVEFEFVDDS